MVTANVRSGGRTPTAWRGRRARWSYRVVVGSGLLLMVGCYTGVGAGLGDDATAEAGDGDGDEGDPSDGTGATGETGETDGTVDLHRRS